MFTLTLDDVKKAAAKYYLEGKLTAQHPELAKRKCVNNGADGYRCAVAASYPEDFKEEGSFMRLLIAGHIQCDDLCDKITIQRIQDAHDLWAAASKTTTDENALTYLEWNFLGQIATPDSEVSCKYFELGDLIYHL